MAKPTFRTPALRALRFAAAMASASGSIPSTLAAHFATPSAKRPSPHPRSKTRFLRTRAGPPHSLSSSRASGRRADDNAGMCLPTSPTEFTATPLTAPFRLNLVEQARCRRLMSPYRRLPTRESDCEVPIASHYGHRSGFKNWSGGRDSNSRSPGPKPGALPS